MSNTQQNRFEIDLALDVQQIRLNRRIFRCSKIDAYKNEIMILRHLNISFNNISHWLNDYHGVHISSSAVNKRFHHWIATDESSN